MTHATDDRGRAAGPHTQSGVTLIELILALGFVATTAGLATPMVVHALDAGRARHAAGFVATRLRLARQQAVFQHRSVGVVFTSAETGWTFVVCTDENGNGIRRADITSGVDSCSDGPYTIEEMFPGIEVAIDATLPGPDATPSSDDPVRFGSSDMASFSASGSCTPGTLYLRSARGVQFAVRVAGPTARTRILRFDPGGRQWLPG